MFWPIPWFCAGMVLLLAGLLSSTVLRAEPAGAVARLAIEPSEIVLAHADQTAQVLVTWEKADGTIEDVTSTASYALGVAGDGGAEKVLEIRQGKVIPRGNGTAWLAAAVQDPVSHRTLAASAKVSVRGFGTDRRINFANDVIPILTKAGCNAGGCHGKASGQNGFRLSLLGFDPEFDFDALVKQGRGRRVFPGAPDRSLLLQKATGQVIHGGGQRLDPSSDAYRLIRRWIVQGMPRGTTNDPRVVQVEVFPRERLLASQARQQLRVVAHYSDQTTQDVTSQAEYKSQQPDILQVDALGAVATLGRTGEGAVMVRYLGQVDVARVTVPFQRSVPPEAFAHFQPRNFIDQLVLEKWNRLGIAPSPVCSDTEFLRRAFLDAIGALPTSEEVQHFLSDPSPDKRSQWIGRILERNEYADYWANLWGDLLRNKRRYGDGYKRGTSAFAAWLRGAFAQNMPYDQFVRAILTAQGNVSDTPPVVWYREVRNPIHQVNDTSQLFLGIRISCANCHNHPYEKWTQNDYWGFAAFYSRLGNKQGEVANENAIFVRKEGETHHPRTGKRMKPKGLGGPEYDYVRGEDPRQKLVDWMTAADNPYFAKAIVNRLWAHFMGVGLVEAVDDMRATNPPSNPPLLDALARSFIEQKYDLKRLVKTIMQAQAYQLSSLPTDSNRTDRQNYARYTTRRLSAETLLDAIDGVTGSPEKFSGFPLGTRAAELPDESVGSYFLDVFGRSQRETACECERSYAPNLAQILHLMNSPEVQAKISSEKGWLSRTLKAERGNSEIIDELYLRAFSRPPRAEELKEASTLVAASQDRKAALEDMEWTLLNTKEFLFNH